MSFKEKSMTFEAVCQLKYIEISWILVINAIKLLEIAYINDIVNNFND